MTTPLEQLLERLDPYYDNDDKPRQGKKLTPIGRGIRELARRLDVPYYRVENWHYKGRPIPTTTAHAVARIARSVGLEHEAADYTPYLIEPREPAA